MKAALYARVSTLKQSCDGQLEELRHYADSRQFGTVCEYIDLGVSGAKDSRPELDRMLNDAKRRKFDVICIVKLDRLGRSLRHLVNLMAELQALNVGLISLKDNLDMTTPAGKLLFAVIGAMAEFERDLIRERVQAGVTRAKENGVKFGISNPKHKLYRQAIDLTGLSGSNSELARKFGVSRQSILRARKRASISHS